MAGMHIYGNRLSREDILLLASLISNRFLVKFGYTSTLCLNVFQQKSYFRPLGMFHTTTSFVVGSCARTRVLSGDQFGALNAK